MPWVLGLWLAGSFLVFLKYYEFARETFQTLLQLTGFVSLLPVADWVAPVGVSFFTFSGPLIVPDPSTSPTDIAQPDDV